MSEFTLIKSIKDFKPKDKNKPKIIYEDFNIDVEGQQISIGIPVRIAENFESILSEKNSFTKRQFRKLMREFRGVQNKP